MGETPRTVLFVVNHAGFFLSHRLSLAVSIRDAGYDVQIATPPSRHVPGIEASGLLWHPILLSRSSRNPFREIGTVASLIGLYRSVRPDLVHHVTAKPTLYGTVAARMTGVPAVVNAFTGLGHLHIAEDPIHRTLRRAVGLGYRLALRHPRQRVIFQNEDDADLFVRKGWLSASDVRLVRGSGVDPARFTPGEKRRNDRPVVLFPSRMLRTKGLMEFIAAARILKADGVEATFRLVGDPDPDNPASVAEDTIRSWVAEGTVEYWGRRESMPEAYAEADIVCLPSYMEGLPKVLLEAGAMGLASVATNVPGCRDVVRDGVEGLLVPAQSTVELADAIRDLVMSPERRVDMGRRARARVLENFTLGRVIEDTLAIYREVLEQ